MTKESLPKRTRLKIAMTQRRLSVENVADMTGRTIRTVYSWTGGEREVPDHILWIVENGEITGGAANANG